MPRFLLDNYIQKISIVPLKLCLLRTSVFLQGLMIQALLPRIQKHHHSPAEISFSLNLESHC